jgi:predicted  nucleic acid-binding Zn-ribbon protein
MSEELEGRVRALEALVMEMGATEQTISAAKTHIREMARRRDKATFELKEKMQMPQDEHAEKALDDLSNRL